jgi:hypothetical protein
MSMTSATIAMLPVIIVLVVTSILVVIGILSLVYLRDRFDLCGVKDAVRPLNYFDKDMRATAQLPLSLFNVGRVVEGNGDRLRLAIG